MTEVEIRLGQLPVAGEKARVDTFVGRAKMHMISQNDGDPVPIILSYRMHFCAACMVMHACHFALYRCGG